MTDGYRVVAYSVHAMPKDYRPLIYAKWLRSLRYGNDYFKLSDPVSYYRAYHAYIDRILADIACVVRLAVLADNADIVLGFSVSRGTALDYVYVQPELRRQGIGTKLVPQGIESITHLTRTALTIWASKYAKWRFDPFA